MASISKVVWAISPAAVLPHIHKNKHYPCKLWKKEWARIGKKKCIIKNKRIAYKLKRYGNQVRKQNPRQQRQKLVRGLASVPNVQVIKFRSLSVELHRDFVLYLSWILFNL